MEEGGGVTSVQLEEKVMILNTDSLDGPPRLQATEKKLSAASLRLSAESGSW